MVKFRLLILGLFSLGLAGRPPAWADEIAPTRIGRISAIEGTASIRPSGGEWSGAGVNDPVGSGMAVRAGDKARAQLRIGPDAIALAAGTRVEIGRLDPGATQIALPQGRIGIHLGRLDQPNTVEIDLPHGGIWLEAPGDYDIYAGDEKNPASIATLDGSARVIVENLDRTVTAGSVLALNGGNTPRAKLDAGAREEAGIWWLPDGGDAAKPQALQFVSAELTGYDALDGNGSWQNVEGLGEVWYPNPLPDDWAPYRYGHWRWLQPWGWTWIDGMPWGFATSHYGRWARIDERWAWVPGPHSEQPVYAPALVAFLGTAGVGISYPDGNGPAVAWFPLAPGEAYWPSYTNDPDTIRRINAGSGADLSAMAAAGNGAAPTAIVNGEYQNRRSASVVPRPVFTAGRAVAPALIDLPERRLDNAPLLAGSPQIPPAATPVQVASAAHTLARILEPRAAPNPTRTVAVLRGGRHSGSAPIKTVAASSHSRARPPHVARERIIAVSTTHTARSRPVHLAAASHHHLKLR
ncbi:MAG TPA: DUF6600 domain-containing protein [Stellaceae bacterium]